MTPFFHIQVTSPNSKAKGSIFFITLLRQMNPAPCLLSSPGFLNGPPLLKVQWNQLTVFAHRYETSLIRCTKPVNHLLLNSKCSSHSEVLPLISIPFMNHSLPAPKSIKPIYTWSTFTGELCNCELSLKGHHSNPTHSIALTIKSKDQTWLGCTNLSSAQSE